MTPERKARLRRPAREPAAQRVRHRDRSDGAEEGVRDVLREEDAHDLAGCEADCLQDGNVAQVAAAPGGDRPVDGDPGGYERADAEQAENLAQEPVVALGLGPCLLPGGDLADGAGIKGGDGALGGVVRLDGGRSGAIR